MKTLQVKLGDNGNRSYPIYIGQNLLSQSKLIEPYVKGNQVLIVTNDTVAPLYLDKVKETFSAYDVKIIILPDGEQYKNIDELNTILMPCSRLNLIAAAP